MAMMAIGEFLRLQLVCFKEGVVYIFFRVLHLSVQKFICRIMNLLFNWFFDLISALFDNTVGILFYIFISR